MDRLAHELFGEVYAESKVMSAEERYASQCQLRTNLSGMARLAEASLPATVSNGGRLLLHARIADGDHMAIDPRMMGIPAPTVSFVKSNDDAPGPAGGGDQ